MFDKQSVARQRRSFLKGVAAAGGATALAAMPRNAVSGESGKPKKADEKPSSKGYRETTHIRDYYASLRI